MSLDLNELQRQIIGRIIRRDKFIAARCGWGSGKTSALVFAILFVARARPGTSILIVTDTTPRYNSVLHPEISKWLEPLGWTFNHTLKLWTDPHSGSTVYARSYYRPDTRGSTHNPLEGLNITSGVCLIDECQTLNAEVAYKALGRLRSGASPILIMVGLPVVDCWWVSMTEGAGYTPLLFSSYVNQDNLSDDWFEATKFLPADEREAMVMNRPKPPTGLVYSEFNETMIIDDFEYDESMTARIAIDWGFRKPSVLILVYDERRDASVIIAEFNPKEVTTEGLAEMILARAWPRELKNQAPSPRVWLDAGVADKAGRARNDQTGASAFRAMRALPPKGLGMALRSTSDPIRTDILNGVQRLKRAFAAKRYLITRDVWERGERSSGNSLRKALGSYAWDKHDRPIKDGREDPLDALRYDCIFYNWHDTAVDQRRYSPRSKGDKKKRTIRVGGASKQSF